MDGELAYLTQERDNIRRQAQDKTLKLDLLRRRTGRWKICTKKDELAGFVAHRIDDAVKQSNSEKTLSLTKTLERARLLEAEAEFDQAIALYEKFLTIAPEQTKVKDHLIMLKTAWEPKNAQHKEARAFLIGDWPKVEAAELAKNLDKARAALAVCKDVQDRLTPLKVMQANVLHASRLEKLLDTLKRQDSADNRAQFKALGPVSENLRRLHAEATELAAVATKE